MATSKFHVALFVSLLIHVVLFVSLLFALIYTQSKADFAVAEKVAGGSFPIEVDKLTSTIQLLESYIDKRNQELKSKDETIAQLENAIAEKEKTIKDKSEFITSLQSQSYAEIDWKENAKSAYESFIQKALEKKAQAENWAEPYVETIKNKWVPDVCMQPKDVATKQWGRITRKFNAFLQA